MSTADAPLPKAPVVPGPAPHLLVVRAPYYTEVVDGLREGALRIIAEAGGTADVIDIAGALELAACILFAVRGTRTRYDGFVALGCVVKGETDHYEHVCREAMQALTRVGLDHALCLGNGLLTVATAEQALERSRQDGHNKGAEAAAAALIQLRAARQLGAA